MRLFCASAIRPFDTMKRSRAQRSGGDDAAVVQFQQRAHSVEEQEFLAVNIDVLDVGRNGV